MSDMQNIAEVKNAVNKLTHITEAANENQNSIFKTLIQELDKVNPDMQGFDVFATLLTLSDEQFNIIAPVFLDELEKSYNNANDSLSMVQALNAAHLTLEDVRAQYEDLCNQIDSQLHDVLSQKKCTFLKQMLGITYNAMADTAGISKRTIIIPLEYCSADAKMPTYAHLSDAGMDIYATEEITINPGETKLVKTGIKMAIPFGYEIQVRPKSGISLKSKLRVANAPGTIDSGYRDEIGIIIDNIDPPIRAIHPRTQVLNEESNSRSIQQLPITEGDIEYGQSYTIGKGEKIAQLVLNEIPKAMFVETDSVANIGENRGGGFGSTGLK